MALGSRGLQRHLASPPAMSTICLGVCGVHLMRIVDFLAFVNLPFRDVWNLQDA